MKSLIKMDPIRLGGVTSFIIADAMANFAVPALALQAADSIAKSCNGGLIVGSIVGFVTTILISVVVLSILDLWRNITTKNQGRLSAIVISILYIVNVPWGFVTFFKLFGSDFPTKETGVNTQFSFLLASILFIIMKLIGYLDAPDLDPNNQANTRK